MYALPWLKPAWAWLSPLIIALGYLSGGGCLMATASGCKSWGEITYQERSVTDPNDPNGFIVVERSPYEDQLLLAKRADALGLEGEITIIGGPGNVGPVYYNLFGTMWHARVKFGGGHSTTQPAVP